MSPVEYAALFGVLVLAAGLQGGLGFGMNLVVAPIAALIEPRLVPGPLVLMALLIALLIGRRERAHIEWSGLGWVTAGRIPGTVAGALFVASVSAAGIALAVAGAVITAALLAITRIALRPTRLTLLTAGVVSGFAGTSSSIGGPMLAVVYANSKGPVVRATLSAIFVVASVISATALHLVGRLGFTELAYAGMLSLPVILGFSCSGWVAAHLDQGRTRAAVLTVAVVGALFVAAVRLV